MRKHRLRCVVLIVVAGMLATAGCSRTSTSQPAAGSTVHLTDYTDNDGPTSTVILTGVIGDYGTAVRDEQHTLALTLNHGSFRLDITDLDKAFASTLANLTVNPTTCSATASVTKPASVVVRSGTGSYEGIGGTFDLTVTLDEVYRPGACSETSEYLAQTIVTTGSGTVTLG